MKLSQMNWSDIRIGDIVNSDTTGRTGTIKDKFINHWYRDGSPDPEKSWVVIYWENGNISHQPYCFLDNVTYLI